MSGDRPFPARARQSEHKGARRPGDGCDAVLGPVRGSPGLLATSLVKAWYGPEVRLWCAAYDHLLASTHAATATWNPGRGVTARRWAVTVSVHVADRVRDATWYVNAPLREILRRGSRLTINEGDGLIAPANANARRWSGLPRLSPKSGSEIAFLGAVDEIDRESSSITAFPRPPDQYDAAEVLAWGSNAIPLLRGRTWSAEHGVNGAPRAMTFGPETTFMLAGDTRPIGSGRAARIVSNGRIVAATLVLPGPPASKEALRSRFLKRVVLDPGR